MVKSSLQDKAFDAVIIIILAVVLFVVLYPLYFVVIASFSDPVSVVGGKVIWWPLNPSLDSYRLVMRNSRVMSGYGNTILYTSTGTVLNVLMTIAAAYPLSRPYLKGRSLVLGLMTFTMFFSGGLIPTYIMISEMHLLDTYWVMVLPTALSVWNVMIMRTFFINSIPGEIEEAATVDGASHLHTLIRIILPLSKPILAVMVLFYAVGHWNSYFNALIYLSSERKFPLQLILRGARVFEEALEQVVAQAAADVGQSLQVPRRLGLVGQQQEKQAHRLAVGRVERHALAAVREGPDQLVHARMFAVRDGHAVAYGRRADALAGQQRRHHARLLFFRERPRRHQPVDHLGDGLLFGGGGEVADQRVSHDEVAEKDRHSTLLPVFVVVVVVGGIRRGGGAAAFGVAGLVGVAHFFLDAHKLAFAAVEGQVDGAVEVAGGGADDLGAAAVEDEVDVAFHLRAVFLELHFDLA